MLFSQTIVDAFSGADFDPVVWDDWAGAQSAIVAGTAQITSPTSSGSWGVERQDPASFDQVYWGTRLLDAGNQAFTSRNTIPARGIVPGSGGGDSFYWRVEDGDLFAVRSVGFSFDVQGATLAYDPLIHRYLAVGVNEDGDLTWLWSTDGANFTVHVTASNVFAVTDFIFIFQLGQDATEAATSTSIFDEFSYWTLVPVPSTLPWIEGEHLLRGLTPDGPVWMSVCGTLAWGVSRPYTVNVGVMGNRTVFSGDSGGRDFTMTIAVESEEAKEALDEILTLPLILVSPADSPEAWAAPITETIAIVKVGEIRQLSVQMIGTGPEPEPEVGDFL